LLSINPANNTVRENYKLLIGSVIPRPIAFITSIGENEVINGAPFSYFNIVSAEPPMISVSVQRKGVEQKDTARNICKHKEFVIHIVDEDNVTKINDTSASLRPNESEVEMAKLTLTESESIKTPGIKEAKIRFECELEKCIELGDGNNINTDFIIGKIVRIHVDEKVYKNGKIMYEKLNAMSRLAGNDYAKIGKIVTIERPK